MFTPRKTVGQLVDEAKRRIENLSTEQLRQELDRGQTQVLDIRDVRERQKLGYIPGSLHVPRGMLEFWLDPTSHYYTGKVDPEKRIVLYCAGGQRSALAADVLREMGFPDVAHLEVGFNGWAAAGLPVDRGDARPPSATGPGAAQAEASPGAARSGAEATPGGKANPDRPADRG
jgi:rhodanese-related sulfurtransferase